LSIYKLQEKCFMTLSRGRNAGGYVLIFFVTFAHNRGQLMNKSLSSAGSLGNNHCIEVGRTSGAA
jgi:hypothetical protein